MKETGFHAYSRWGDLYEPIWGIHLHEGLQAICGNVRSVRWDFCKSLIQHIIGKHFLVREMCLPTWCKLKCIIISFYSCLLLHPQILSFPPVRSSHRGVRSPVQFPCLSAVSSSIKANNTLDLRDLDVQGCTAVPVALGLIPFPSCACFHFTFIRFSHSILFSILPPPLLGK